MAEQQPDLERMLELYREAKSPEAGAQERVWSSVEASIGAGAGGGESGAPAAASSVLPKLALVGGAALLVGAAFWWNARPAPAPEPPPPVVVTASVPQPGPAPEAAPEPETETGTGAEPVTAPAAEPEPEPVIEAATTSEPARPAEPSGPRATLAAEMRLMTAAQRALREGDSRRALAELRKHRARFPRGVMAEEREAERAVLLCELGRTAQGRRAASAFAERFPGSPLAAKVRRACTLEAP